MTGRVNWARLSSRNRMQRQGVEDIKGKTPVCTENLGSDVMVMKSTQNRV